MKRYRYDPAYGEGYWPSGCTRHVHNELLDNAEYRECLNAIIAHRMAHRSNKAAVESLPEFLSVDNPILRATKMIRERTPQPFVKDALDVTLIVEVITHIGNQGLGRDPIESNYRQPYWRELSKLWPIDERGLPIGDPSSPIESNSPGNPAMMPVIVDEEESGEEEMAGEQKLDIQDFHMALLDDTLYYQAVSPIADVRKSVETSEQAIEQILAEHKYPSSPVWTAVRMIRGSAKRRGYKDDKAIVGASFERIVFELVHIINLYGLKKDTVCEAGAVFAATRESEEKVGETMTTPDDDEEPMDASNLLAKAIGATGGVRELESSLKLPKGSIKKWGGKIPPEHLLAVKRVTGLPSSDFIDEINNDPDNEDDEQEDEQEDEQMELDEPQFIKPKPPSIVSAINDICDRRDDKIREQARHLGMMTFEDMLTFIEQEAKINGITPHTVLNLAIRIKNRLK